MSNEHFDAVVIGSGFGGSVMACRLAEAGLKVCLLERGKPYPPDSFPRAPFKLRSNFWDPSGGLYGMFNVWSFKGSGALVSSGLGGGSLIYANVLLRKDEKWFVREDLSSGGYEHWPVTRADLEPHYEQVERMMNAQQYPFDHPPYDQTPKTRAMKDAAARLGLDWQLPKLAVAFRRHRVDQNNPDDPHNPPLVGEPFVEEPGHENLHGRTRSTCRLCGECDIGCNYGSKNTLDFNYLSEAKRQGALVRTLCEVRSFEPRALGGYTVRYVEHDLAREGRKFDTSQLPQKEMTCARLIISAGTFGSPYLLLKNRSAFPRLSPRLGSRFGVNGDLLSFILKAKEKRNGDRVPRTLDPSFGPVITSAIRVSDALDTGGADVGAAGGRERGFYVEDGGHPEFVNWLMETASDVPSAVERLINFGRRSLWGLWGLNPDADLSSAIADLMGPADFSKSSMPILSMGRDIPDGQMRLRGKYLDVDWNTKKSQAYYDRLVKTVRDIAGALDAEYMDNLPYKYLRQVFTAHPLGGCPMGRNSGEGVV
ncbi:MAG: GMC family oxidoreductase N-terminal domain-containing protein, partial [Pyrinomonadaceae bacterium]